MLLAIYLNDHFAGATAGLELARRAAASHEDSSHGPFLTELAEQIAEDRAALRQIMAALGIRVDPLKVGAAWLAEKLGRAKLNGRLRSPSPLSPVIELEGLALGVTGKDACWRTLEQLQPHTPALARFDLPALRARAASQRERLEAHRREALAVAFA
jgi:hypothetical protein